MAERYPTVRAGQKVTGSLLDSMLPKTVRKTADTARTTTTLSADPELQITVEANAVYIVDCTLYVTVSDITGPDVNDINVDFTAPGTTDGSWSGTAAAVNSTATDGITMRNIGTAITSARSFGVGSTSASAPGVVLITATLITGSTSGTYSLDWALLSDGNPGTVTVLQDSYLKLIRIA